MHLSPADVQGMPHNTWTKYSRFTGLTEVGLLALARLVIHQSFTETLKASCQGWKKFLEGM